MTYNLENFKEGQEVPIEIQTAIVDEFIAKAHSMGREVVKNALLDFRNDISSADVVDGSCELIND